MDRNVDSHIVLKQLGFVIFPLGCSARHLHESKEFNMLDSACLILIHMHIRQHIYIHTHLHQHVIILLNIICLLYDL